MVVVAKDLQSRDPLQLPMFMGMAAAAKEEVKLQYEQVLPFVNSGVGFEVQPLAAAKKRQAEDRKQTAEKRVGKQSELHDRASMSDDGFDNNSGKLQRCRYIPSLLRHTFKLLCTPPPTTKQKSEV